MSGQQVEAGNHPWCIVREAAPQHSHRCNLRSQSWRRQRQGQGQILRALARAPRSRHLGNQAFSLHPELCPSISVSLAITATTVIIITASGQPVLHLPPLPCAFLDCAPQGHPGARPGVAESPGSPQPEMVGEARVGGQKEVEGERRGGERLTCQKGRRRGSGTGLAVGPRWEPGQQGVFTFCGLPLRPGIGGPRGTRCFSPELILGFIPGDSAGFPEDTPTWRTLRHPEPDPVRNLASPPRPSRSPTSPAPSPAWADPVQPRPELLIWLPRVCNPAGPPQREPRDASPVLRSWEEEEREENSDARPEPVPEIPPFKFPLWVKAVVSFTYFRKKTLQSLKPKNASEGEKNAKGAHRWWKVVSE